MFCFLVQGPFGSMIPAMHQTISKDMRETQQFDKSHFVNERFWSIYEKSAYFCNKKAFGYYGINIFLYFWIDITSLLGVPF